MITKVLTGITHSSYTTTSDIPFGINDTFYSNSNISFTCTLSAITDILSKTINAGNVTNYALYYRLVDNFTNNATILSETIDLTSSMIVNSSLIVDLTDLNSTITHNYLLDDMNDDEIYLLTKQYSLIIRIYQKSTAEETTHLANLNTILNDDIVQNINYILNGLNNGPYDVEYIHLDLASKNDFSLEELKNIFNDNPLSIGDEYFRIFYPKNKERNNKCPLFIFFHGQGQLCEDYDLYLRKLASYGYFCISVHHTSSFISFLGSFEAFVKELDHFKNNIDVFKNGIFRNLIDFNKINFSGHSRGGGYALGISEFIRVKNFRENIQNITINYSDIKSIIPIAQATGSEINFLKNGMDNENILTLSNFSESDIQNLFFDYNVPTLYFQSRIDSDVQQIVGRNCFLSHLNGFSFEIKRNLVETAVITPCFQFNHNGYALQILNREDFGIANENSFTKNISGSRNFLHGRPKYSKVNETGYEYNSLVNHVNYLSREILNFICIQNFSSNKVKKIRIYNKIDFHNYDDKIKSFYNFNIKYSNNDIDFYLDEFNGITMSLAGITGITFTSGVSPIGFTYDYCQEYFLSRILEGSSDAPLNNLYLQKNTRVLNDTIVKYIPISTAERLLSKQKCFSGFFNTTYRGVQFDVNNINTFIGYTFNTNLSLTDDSFLVLKGGLPDLSNSVVNPSAGTTYGYSIATNGIAGNTLDANFIMTLYDNNNNSSSLSSKLYNNGFAKNLNFSSNPSFYHYTNDTINTSIGCMYFRAGDFYLKNTNLDLSNINQILLSFGPSYGSTHCTVGLDEFFVLKNL